MSNQIFKAISIALIVLSYAGCGSRSFLDGSAAGRNRQSIPGAERDKKLEAFKQLIDELERAGLFKHTDRDLIGDAKAEAKRYEYLFAGSTERDQAASE